MGLYGNIVVVPSDPDYWPTVNREELLTLDDVLLENGQIASFSRTETTYVAMGRFGNSMLIGGDVTAELPADLGRWCASTSPTPPTHGSLMSASTRPG
jgi:hypothetical protein